MRTLALALAVTFATAAHAEVGQGRDPFAAFGSDAPPTPACEEQAGVICQPIDELTLRAVVTGTATPRAMFEDKSGKSHMVRVGDSIGGMRVKALRRDTVVLEATLRNWEGYVTKRDVLVALR